MITAAINIGIYTLIFFLVGMYKPKWALFFMKTPDRFIVSIFTVVFIMISLTLFGEGTRQKQPQSEISFSKEVPETTQPN